MESSNSSKLRKRPVTPDPLPKAKSNNKATKKPQTKPKPVAMTPPSKIKKPKEKTIMAPGSVTKSAKKSWQRKPKAAHSGVPVPEKLKKLLQRRLSQDMD